jgi:hypothetical protein
MKGEIDNDTPLGRRSLPARRRPAAATHLEGAVARLSIKPAVSSAGGARRTAGSSSDRAAASTPPSSPSADAA